MLKTVLLSFPAKRAVVWGILTAALSSSPLFALTLEGHLTSSSEKGRIGIRISSISNTITHIYNKGTLCKGILLEGDKIRSADGYKDVDHLRGEVGSVCSVEVLRNGEVKTFSIERVPNSVVKD